MSHGKSTFALGVALVASACIAVLACAQEGHVWGGRHVAMEVTEAGANLEFDCATGTITEPLPLERSGTFQVKGTFTPEHGGPVRANEVRPTRNATYSGTVEGDTLHLHITIEGISGSQDYVLTRGKAARLIKCR